ncbi:MAG: polysaccharide deacetylase [Chitinophagales bacterium]|nr:MAG: polysaccharide deacetylase [Chitinophagales bacterium]
MVKVPGFFWRLFPGLVWRIPNHQGKIYLTFDDGPNPSTTEFILDTLDQYNAKATFFCTGANAETYPKLYKAILEKGHAVGNHTYHHLSGWQADDESYYDDVSRCAEVVKSNLFRPPYGQITLSQIAMLKPLYRIVMWDVMAGDFDEKLRGEHCFLNVIRSAHEGSIIVFHDSAQAEPRLKHALPRVIEYFSVGGYQFEPIPA